MRITRIESLIVRLPLEPSENATTREWSLVLVHTDTGLQGMGRGGDPAVISRDLAPLLEGQDL